MKKTMFGSFVLLLLCVIQSWGVDLRAKENDRRRPRDSPSNGELILARDRSPSLPNVLLVGDAITADYLGVVHDGLQGRANVDALIDTSGKTAPEFLSRLATALADGPSYAVIHFSLGLDPRTPEPGAAASFNSAAKKNGGAASSPRAQSPIDLGDADANDR